MDQSLHSVNRRLDEILELEAIRERFLRGSPRWLGHTYAAECRRDLESASVVAERLRSFSTSELDAYVAAAATLRARERTTGWFLAAAVVACVVIASAVASAWSLPETVAFAAFAITSFVIAIRRLLSSRTKYMHLAAAILASRTGT